MGSPDYPRMLYRAGSSALLHGHWCDTLIVSNASAEDAAVEEGWGRAPDALDHDGDGRKGGARRRRKGAA